MTGFTAPLVLAALSVAGLVIADFHSYHGSGRVSFGRLLCKPLASCAFIWLALLAGAMDSVYGQWLLAALLLCMLGDLCLMFENDLAFLAGLVSFLCGHLLYAVAFLQLPGNPRGLVYAAVPAAALFLLSLRWLRPHLPANMRVPVFIYTGVITAMLLCASLSWGLPAAALIITGASGFALSDLAVARRQFVHPGPLNGLWGTPLYFGSQLLLAASIAVVNSSSG
jgi:uncharacterized membrane protein YhhN